MLHATPPVSPRRFKPPIVALFLENLDSSVLFTSMPQIARDLKPLAEPILRRFGFRRVLIFNGLLAVAFTLIPGSFTPGAPWTAKALVL